MIKLIASDLDGTLLNSKKELTDKTAAAIAAVQRKGVHFVAASGRQYYNLVEVFEKRNMRRQLSFLAENGTIVFHEGELIFVNPLRHGLVAEVVQAARSLPQVYPILCGVSAAYLENQEEEIAKEANRYFARQVVLPDVLQALRRDQIVKVALLDVHGRAEQNIYPAFSHFESHAQVLVSGAEWIDIINHGVSKGTGLELIADRLGASFDERMAFGDYLNDIELMKACRYSFAMQNAHPKLKEVASDVCGSNDEDGVANKLIEFFSLDVSSDTSE